MAEQTIKKITDKLNEAFQGTGRKLVFWYDDNGDFSDDIDSIELENAEIYRLTADSQFETKLFLERGEGKNRNYLIYAPFPKPSAADNHLEDTFLYSRSFNADRISLICADLNLGEEMKPVLQNYSKYLASEQRRQRLYNLLPENVNKRSLETALLCSVCGTTHVSFDEALRIVITQGETEDNRYLNEFEKYGMTDIFWRECSARFGYMDSNPTLPKMLFTFFVTCTLHEIKCALPAEWKSYISGKAADIMVFMDSIRNNIALAPKYDELSYYVDDMLRAKDTLSVLSIDSIAECDTFFCIDSLIIRWLNDTLLNEDTGAKLSGYTVPEICRVRRRKHFGGGLSTAYDLIESAWHIISAASYKPSESLGDIAKRYTEKDYETDGWYRKFIFSLDNIDSSEFFKELARLVENIYTEYLGKLLPAWNKAFTTEPLPQDFPLERKFYNKKVKILGEQRIVVIISDAMRYEVGKELSERIAREKNCGKVSVEWQLSTLPSFTPLGMAALLPHDSLDMTDNFSVLADGKSADGIQARDAILKSHEPGSVCLRFDDVIKMSQNEMRVAMASRQIIYIYHNKIDATGESQQLENEVFTACGETIDEISRLIVRVSNAVGVSRFIVTADHGFIYKREPLSESDKISAGTGNGKLTERRFVIGSEAISETGVAHVSLGKMLGNDDARVISFPESVSVFKAGGGMNYVHGGSSPQEMIVPVLNVTTVKAHPKASPVTISLRSTVSKITNLITHLYFIQSDPVGKTVTARTFRILFIAEDGTPISNDCILVADSEDPNASMRETRLTFTLVDRAYSPAERYFLIAYDMDSGVETYRREMKIDIAITVGFDFE